MRDHVSGNRSLRDIQVELEKLTGDLRSAPQLVGTAHLADEINGVLRDGFVAARVPLLHAIGWPCRVEPATPGISIHFKIAIVFAFSVTGTAPHGFVLQASTNLLGWNSLSTNSLVGGRADFTNSDPISFPRGFYRAQAVP